jgi:hypothetical protein
MEIKSKLLGPLLLVILFGGISLTITLGWWATTADEIKTPATLTSGEAAGQYDPGDIRGSYTLDDIERNFSIPVATMSNAFGIPLDNDTAGFQLKELGELYEDLENGDAEIGTASMRLFVAIYTGLPYEMDEEVYLPQAAVSILETQGTLSPGMRTYLETHTVETKSP